MKKARDAYTAQLQKGKEMGLDEAAQAEPVRRSEKDTQDIEGTETMACNSAKTHGGPKVYSKSFHSRRCLWAELRVYSQLSGLEDVVFNDFIKDDCIPEGDGQVASGSAALPDPIVLETECRC